MEVVTPFKEVIEEIKQNGGERVKFCYQCGKCDAVCPWNKVTLFSMRRLVRDAVLGLTEIEKEDIWRCTTCGKCVLMCPRDVRQIDDITAIRRMATAYNVFPSSTKTYRQIATYLLSKGNPFNEDPKERAKWAEGLDVKIFHEKMEVLYFTCCYLSYDPRLKNVARATVQLLKKAGVDFGILGEAESCCGESIRKTGNEEVFKRLAKENIKKFVDFGVRKIVVSSPHCYYTFKNEYPLLGGAFEVIHISEFIKELIDSKRLNIEKEYKANITYHDPCYLGRHSNIFDQPRNVLRSVKGVELYEFPKNRDVSMCCGMGGGRIWAETEKEQRFSNLRVEDAAKLGAEELVTSCPYCITALEDSKLIMGYEGKLRIKDIAELINEVT